MKIEELENIRKCPRCNALNDHEAGECENCELEFKDRRSHPEMGM